MRYAEAVARSALLQRLPFEHLFRGIPHSAFVNRLITERNLFEGPVASFGHRDHAFATLIVVVDSVSDDSSILEVNLELTLSSWLMQTCPWTNCYVVVPDPGTRDVTAQWEIMRYAGLSARDALNLKEETIGEYLIFGKPGDIYHPSLATSIVFSVKEKHVDFFAWSTEFYEQRADKYIEISRFVRATEREPITTWHVNHTGRSFAVNKRLAMNYPGNLLEQIAWVDAHPFHAWVSMQSTIAYAAQPEYLSLCHERTSNNLTKENIAKFPEAYDLALKSSEVKFTFVEVQDRSQEMFLEPLAQISCVSIVIPFRDMAEATCSCVSSLLRQRLSSHLEIVLVNNQSSPAALAHVKEYISESRGAASIRFIDYDRPFNHSEQCNIGIRQSQGDVVLLLNNDAELVSEDALSCMSRWAMVPGVGTVGCRIVSENGALVCAGIKSRANLGYEYHSFAEESRDPSYATVIRETFANTFACTAISRRVLESYGLFDAVQFPNGYNDIEYCMRLRSRGYRHVYLGHIIAKHSPGTSRGRCDEVAQKIALRRRYPDVMRYALLQLETDNHLLVKNKKGLDGIVRKPLRSLREACRLMRQESLAVRGPGDPKAEVIPQ